jgi:poly(A)-specific ribonuclease
MTFIHYCLLSYPFSSLFFLIQALDKSKNRDGLRAVRKYIPKLKQDLELLRAQSKSVPENKTDAIQEIEGAEIEIIDSESCSNFQLNKSDKLKEILDKECSKEDPMMDIGMASDSEDLSDIFETESDTETEDKVERPLYLDEFEKFPVESDGECEDFEDHLRQISVDSKNVKSWEKDSDSPNFDEVDRIFLRAASLLKKKRR